MYDTPVVNQFQAVPKPFSVREKMHGLKKKGGGVGDLTGVHD